MRKTCTGIAQMRLSATFIAILCFLPVLAQARPIPAAVARPGDRLFSCGSVMPASSLDDNARGVTDLSIHISPAGLVSAASVTVSSGNDGYDAAAIRCANAFFTQPAYQDGAPIDIDWVARIDWRRPRQMTYMSIPLRDESLRFCTNYPDAARRGGEEGPVLVTFIVTADGRMREPEIGHSSGYDDLDAAAISCISAYSYFPATHDGKPVEFEWRAGAVYSLR